MKNTQFKKTEKFTFLTDAEKIAPCTNMCKHPALFPIETDQGIEFNFHIIGYETLPLRKSDECDYKQRLKIIIHDQLSGKKREGRLYYFHSGAVSGWIGIPEAEQITLIRKKMLKESA